MKKIEMLNKIIEAESILNNVKLDVSSSSSGAIYKNDNWQEILKAFNTLYELKIFDKYVQPFLKNEVLSKYANNSIYINANTYKEFKMILSDIELSIYSIKRYLEINLIANSITDDEVLLDIDIPVNVDLEKLSKICKDLSRLFDACPLFADEVKFKGVEKGSIILFVSTSAITAAAIGSIVKVAYDILMQHQNYKLTLKTIESLDGVSNYNTVIQDAIKKQLDLIVKKDTEKLKTESMESEDYTRLTESVNICKDLLESGIKIECSLLGSANSSVQSQFLTTEEYKKIIEIPQKLIE